MADESDAAAELKLEFHYIKGPNYREVPCHGAIGGLTPQGQLWLALYAERPPLPRIVQYEVPAPPEGETHIAFNERGAKPAHIDTREGIIRHVEFSTYLDMEAAERLRDWLDLRIAESKSAKPRPATKRRRRRVE